MTKRFKFRIFRFISCFQSYRTKHPSPTNSKSNPKQPHHHSSLRRHVSSALVACGLRSRPNEISDDRRDYLWRKEDKWHVVDAKVVHQDDDEKSQKTPSRRKIYNSSASGGSGLDDDVLPLPYSKKRRVYKRNKTTTPRRRFSTSSADHTCGGILFSSDGYDEEETESLVPSSSRSFSTENSSVGEEKRKKKKARRSGGAARLERAVPWRESMAVVKKSENPYGDFRRSMLEMIVDKKMYEEKDLEELLCCFLSLNSPKHHGLIIQAFTDIWEAFFCFLGCPETCIGGNGAACGGGGRRAGMAGGATPLTNGRGGTGAAMAPLA
ncbi:transcription repressor OFP7 [Senna tora]|uniref:Transcription repressor n=1 Tax=Senna tora TaxID=362788 RepID=A0A834SSY4_9FABA|nr:transcription repressor OFP7 [Senna tora]